MYDAWYTLSFSAKFAAAVLDGKRVAYYLFSGTSGQHLSSFSAVGLWKLPEKGYLPSPLLMANASRDSHFFSFRRDKKGLEQVVNQSVHSAS